MFKRTMSAVAKSDSVIEMYIDKEFCTKILKQFSLYIDGKVAFVLKPTMTSESHSSTIYSFIYKHFKFVPGHVYEILTEQNYYVPVDISYLATTEGFEKTYRYDGKLGAIYSPNATVFRVFSPLSSEVSVKIMRKGSHEVETHNMHHHLDTGIFEVTIDGDLDGAKYRYSRMMFGVAKDCIDPYSFSLDSNGRHSFVINPKKVDSISSHSECLPPFDDRMKAIIYECNVRDMTSKTDLPDKGTFNALAREGLKDKNGNPIGLDYLSSLGVSHIQLMPVLDFQSVNEDDPWKSYNWGYDPFSYFAPEGSYSSDPNDPYARVLELKNLISKLHQHGMRVVLDVVYNHVYSETFNALSILCPSYYFRLDEHGGLSNGTGCGNDIESRHYMARKLIVDSLLHLLKMYDVDGFRFDLMGILDIDTVKEGYEALTKIKKNILYYGEGWDLWTALPYDQKASTNNAYQLPFCSFFNDRFRDVVKGKTNESEIWVRGYLLGDTNYRDGFKHVILGSAVPIAFAPMFVNPNQSVNYVECHDNHTLYDKIKKACPEDSEEDIYRRIKLHTATTLLALGIPFFHAGQEIGFSKKGNPNTYNAGDELNGFDYELLKERKSLYQYFIDCIKVKKLFIELAGKDYDRVCSNSYIDNLDYGAVQIKFELTDYYVYVIVNPTKNTFMHDFDDYVRLLLNETGMIMDRNIYVNLAIINGLSLNVFYAKKNPVSVSDKEGE